VAAVDDFLGDPESRSESVVNLVRFVGESPRARYLFLPADLRRTTP
jgi:hypothetical protein